MQNEVITDTIKSAILNESFSIALLHSVPFVTGQLYRPDYNLIVFVTKGKATLTADAEIFEVNQNSMLLISKGQVYSFLDADAEGYILKFGNCFWDKTPISASNCKAVLFDSGSSNRQFLLSAESKNELAALFDAALSDYESDYYSNKPDALAAYLKIIIIKIANIHSLLQQSTGTYDTKLYQNFMILVQQDFKKNHNVAEYADKLKVSPRKLYDVCKTEGTGAKEIINEELITEAKRLLQFTSQPVKEIAASIGFTTPYHFSSFFKKHTGISPANFKQELVETDM
jgi:AraC-like DNA-binding protein